jgi:magnesium chelatase family protein
LHGLDGRLIRVEVDVAPGLPGFTIVGLADAALQEARERVRGAIRNSGLAFPPRRITVNLAPADQRKAGAGLDLAIGLGILLGSEQVRAGGRWGFIGELSLGGEVRPVPGILPMVTALVARGTSRIVVPAAAAREAGLVRGAEPVPVATLGEAIEAVRPAGRRRIHPTGGPARVELAAEIPVDSPTEPSASAGGPLEGARSGSSPIPDLAEVRGQLLGRRALEIALAGGHGIVLTGPPGSGKTLLARTIPGLLPPLDDDEARVASAIASAAGDGPLADLVRTRPFRAPHHTISYAGMIGGGPRLAPGEVTRADAGVLFLDELPEFARDVLEALRGPLEDGLVSVVRVGGSVVLPARFQLVAAMNPCPCGGAAGPDGGCGCTPGAPERYAARISGPLRDRIDLWAEMPGVAPASLVVTLASEPSSVVAGRIASARSVARERTGTVNGRLSGARLRRACRLGPAEERGAARLASAAGLSARGVERSLRVARTIADLDVAERVRLEHLEEAVRYRVPGRSVGRRLAS